MSEYRYHPSTGIKPHKVQKKTWYDWRTVYSAALEIRAKVVLHDFQKREMV